MSRIKKYCLVTLASITLIAHLQGALVHRFTFDETFQHSPLSDIAGGSTASSTGNNPRMAPEVNSPQIYG